jgi:ferrochelatase
VFTAHSIPVAGAALSPYATQLEDAAALVAAAAAPERAWSLVFQSRSGAPGQSWLEPDVNDHLRALAAANAPGAVIVPIGFTSDHMEVIYDLDVLAAQTASEIELPIARAATVGVDPRFVAMVAELVQERLDPTIPRRALGTQGPWPDACPAGCCLAN